MIGRTTLRNILIEFNKLDIEEQLKCLDVVYFRADELQKEIENRINHLDKFKKYPDKEARKDELKFLLRLCNSQEQKGKKKCTCKTCYCKENGYDKCQNCGGEL